MKNINLKKYISSKSAIFVLVLFVSIFLFGNYAAAGWEHGVVAGIIGVFISGITKILILLVNVLISVASYSDFIHAAAVTKGWVVVRDVCNMFFVVILLIIAFATILGKEEFSAKKNLPKLIMAAVLINFSKMFCGLMIDVANVVMLTFVNAFKEIGSGNIIDMLGISDVLRYGSGGEAPSFSSTVSAYIFGLIYVLIATVVIASMLAMLVMRVVMIWIYIVLSPAAFFLQAVPGKGQQYASQWWTEWSNHLITGPILAFFLWLSFAALQTGTDPIPVASNNQNESETAAYATADAGSESIDSKAGSVSGFAKFAIAIGMLIGGMQVAQKAGGSAASALGKGMGAINKGKALAIGGASAVGGYALGRAKALGKAGAGAAGRGTRNAGLGLVGAGMNRLSGRDPITGKRKTNVFGDTALQWRDDLKSARQKTKTANREKFLKSMGVGEKTAEKGKAAFDQLKSSENFQSISRGAKNIVTGAGVGAGAGLVTGMIAGSSLGPAGTVLGGVGGLMVGMVSKNKYNSAKTDNAAYEAATGFGSKAGDEGVIALRQNYKDQTGEDPDWSDDDRAAADRLKKYQKNKKIITNRDENPAFNITGKALKSMTGKKKAAEDWVGIAAADPDYLKNVGKGGLYSSSGINDVWKRRLDELNKGGANSVSAISHMETEIAAMNPIRRPKDGVKLEEFTKLISAYEKGGSSVDGATLGRIKTALSAHGYDTANYTDRVLTNYKGVGSNMRVEAGSGSLQYDAFAKNSAKEASKRNSAKDVMGVSFAKLNNKLPANFKLDTAAGVNQQVGGAQLQELSKAMSSIIDDEIASLQAVGSEASENSIAQLNLAKSRLASGDLSGLSLKNTDVKYNGANDSERRRNEYNTVQHETMHQAGAKNEELVDASSNALQDAKLVGRIPGNSNQRYDQEIGKLIASMEKNNSSSEAIGEAVANQIDKWQPTSNAQRVIETETGVRDTISEIAQPAAEIKTVGMEKAINKLTSSLERSMGLSGQNKGIQLSPAERDFFRKLSAKQNKISSTVVEKLKPLGAMAAAEEKKRNP